MLPKAGPVSTTTSRHPKKHIKFQIETVSYIVRLKTPGRYTLSKLYGDQWPLVLRPRWYGIKFKKAVRDGLVTGVRWVGRNSSKHQLYEVLSRAESESAAGLGPQGSMPLALMASRTDFSIRRSS